MAVYPLASRNPHIIQARRLDSASISTVLRQPPFLSSSSIENNLSFEVRN